MEGQNVLWKRWNRVDESLRIALETTLLAGIEPEYVDGLEIPPVGVLEENKMIYRAKAVAEKRFNPLLIKSADEEGRGEQKETVDRHYHPSIGGSPFLRSAVRRVAFKIHIKKGDKPENGLFKRLCFHKHSGKKTPASLWCGRASEKKPFGFDTDGNFHYVNLSYPGRDGGFELVFIKVSDAGLALPYYLKVEAHDEDGGVVFVEVSKVDSRAVPAFLREQY